MRLFSIVLAFYFGLLSLAPNWQGLEFFKLDALFEHYAQYQEEKTNDGFWSFVKENYLQQVNENQHEHRELPFKSVQANVLITLFMPVNCTSVVFEEFTPQLISSPIVTPPTAININDFFECWHPPQLV